MDPSEQGTKLAEMEKKCNLAAVSNYDITGTQFDIGVQPLTEADLERLRIEQAEYEAQMKAQQASKQLKK